MVVPSVSVRSNNPNNRRSGMTTERTPILGTSIANAGALSWINPENAPIYASIDVHFTTAGTGTIDIGISDDGTGAAVNVIDGGTLVGVITSFNNPRSNRGDPALATGERTWYRVEASGVAGDSIVGKMSDTTASTAVGTAYIRYYLA